MLVFVILQVLWTLLRTFVFIISARGNKSCSVTWMSVVTDKAEFKLSGPLFPVYFCLCTCWSTQNKRKKLRLFFLLFFSLSSSKSKQHDSVYARSIQIPSGRRQNASGSECTSHPVARSISTFGPLEEDEKENQKISHIIPTGSLPATLQGPTVCSFSTLKIIFSRLP